MTRNGRRHVMAHQVEDEIRLQTNLGGLHDEDLPVVFGALAQHLGLDPEPMAMAAKRKQITKEPPDPRFPELTVLIRKARRDWTRWGERLVERLTKLLERGQLLPMTVKNEQALQELFRDHEQQITIQMSGHAPDKKELRRLVKKGLITAAAAERSYLDVAWKLGRGLEMLEGHKYRPKKRADLEGEVKKALARKMTPADEEALAYVRRHGAIYMRKPARLYTGEAERVLNAEEYRIVRGALAEGIEKKWNPKRVARALNDAVQGVHAIDPVTGEEVGRFQNDFERVARTELAFAHNHGAYTSLKNSAAEAGEHDPLVYKFASPMACEDCQRIWGPPGNPRRYRLSEIEAREDAGGNFRVRPRRNWGPTIGPTHPHCLCGPLMYYHPRLMELIQEAADEFTEATGS